MKFIAILLAVICIAALIAAIWFPAALGQLLLTAAITFVAALIFAAIASMQADSKVLK